MAGKTKGAKETPLMKQYNAIKAKHPGALLLFRVGDFYETFGEDAEKASKILDIVLTKRSNGSASEVALAGFPHHAMDNYLPKLVRAGQRVAICDQLEDPKEAKGIVKRGVTELVTPGLSLNDQVLQTRSNNYLAAIFFDSDSVGVSFLDISTGEFLTSQGDARYAEKLIQGFSPSEIIYAKSAKKAYFDLLGQEYSSYAIDDWVFSLDFGYEKLTKHFKTSSLKGFGVEEIPSAIISAGAVLHYLEETEHNEITHINSISRIERESHIWLDKFTIRNLELIYPQHEGGIPLIEVLDSTLTPMGGRLLKNWMVLPLKDINQIEARQRVVEGFVKDSDLRDLIAVQLNQMGDLARLAGKVAVRRINPRELNSLRKCISLLSPIQGLLVDSGNEILVKEGSEIDNCAKLLEKIDTELSDEPPIVTHNGGMIKAGVAEELDKLRKIAFSGKDHLLEIQHRESKRTGITSLKISFNKVFGYYLEVSNTHKDKVPTDWIRKQTLVNAERYITEELKDYEEKILNAEDKLIAIEQRIFGELVEYTAAYIQNLQNNSRILAKIDCLLSFAQKAVKNSYTQPKINDSLSLDIEEGRHPVIERQMQPGESYVPNDVFLDDAEQQIMIITGPNMAGKSALLRQTALIVIMAQMGSFVPAKKATIGLIDKVFTRVGASDNVSKGESTFMVEMIETASILNNLSNRSLLLMDEIGRGTSTYDGVSIAWSIVEYLYSQKSKPKTLFATHYHELNQLESEFPGIKNFNVSVKEVRDKVLFLRKLKPGGSEHSFGIHVAQMAGMPNAIVIRANEIMRHLEKDHSRPDTEAILQELPKSEFQLNLFEADERFIETKNFLDEIDINTISPVEALLKLNELMSKFSS